MVDRAHQAGFVKPVIFFHCSSSDGLYRRFLQRIFISGADIPDMGHHAKSASAQLPGEIDLSRAETLGSSGQLRLRFWVQETSKKLVSTSRRTKKSVDTVDILLTCNIVLGDFDPKLGYLADLEDDLFVVQDLVASDDPRKVLSVVVSLTIVSNFGSGEGAPVFDNEAVLIVECYGNVISTDGLASHNDITISIAADDKSVFSSRSAVESEVQPW